MTEFALVFYKEYTCKSFLKKNLKDLEFIISSSISRMEKIMTW